MKRIQTRLGSLFTAVAMLLSLAVTPAMAANTQDPPTEVTNCEASGFYTTILALGFSDSDSDWMNAITGAAVENTRYTKGEINSFSSTDGIWEVGNATGAYGSYRALKLALKSDTKFPVTITISADGYKDLTVKVEKTGYSSYTATVVQDTPSQPETAYTVTTAADITKGTVTVDPASAKAGETVTVTVAPNKGYELDTISVTSDESSKSIELVDKDNGQYTFVMPAENVTVSAMFKAAQVTPSAGKKIALSQVKLSQDMFGIDWYVTFGEETHNYVSAISGITVNGAAWEANDYAPSSGGAYQADRSNNRLVFAAKDYSPNPTIPVLKSGDVITITATGYEKLTFKLIIDKDGNASLSGDTETGDPYKLYVKIEGSFEAAIVGQKDYDGVSSASTGGASSNKNSAVTVYGALMKDGASPADADWEKLDHLSKINLNGPKCSVSIVPNAEKNTAENANSGMEGVYMKLSSDLTLNGTPKDAGSYLVSVHIEDNQGHTADSNTLPFRIYTGEETLADQIKTENLKKYQSGLYAWDIMEPWAIKNFGSNVNGEENSVRVPENLEVWYGSHTSGTYGVLGSDIAWEDVKADKIPQTLYIPKGCNLTLMNMKILSSVRIVVENGGKLTLRDSTVQGIIDVQGGGTFSMNYDSFNQKFETGASICGQLRLADGAVLENAAIYSHTNYLANGNLTDRSNDDAVVAAKGNVTVKGQVFIRGDEAGSTMKGQTALRVSNGTLTLADDAVLVTYGGGGNVTLYSSGGSAVELDKGSIAGKGKLVAIGGPVLFGSGDEAVAGTGSVDVSEVFLQGATAYEHQNGAQPGKACASGVTVKADKQHIADGTLVDGAANDPLADLYWKTGTQATPDLNKYIISGYVLMNIPYNAFYAEEKKRDTDTVAQVDAVSSATKSNPLSSRAAKANSYHNSKDGSDISGITYPVHVSDLSALRSYTRITDADELKITVTLHGEQDTTTYKGKEALFGAPDYAYYVLPAEETPASYKELTVSNGTLSFGKATATAEEANGVTVSLTTNGHHAYYELKVKVAGDGLAEDIKKKTSAVTLHTTDGNVYGLRHVVEIWSGTKLGFGFDSALQGQTIDTITYYLNDGTIQTIRPDLKIPKSTKNVTATVESALNTAHEAAVTVENLPRDFDAQYAVASGNTDLSAYHFAVADGKLTWAGTPAFGAYTLTITDKSGAYAPVSTSFELQTADVIAKYDASKKALVKASGAVTDEQLAAYLKAISAVSVDEKSYAASGKGAVTIIKDGGAIDLTAGPFSKGDGASYSVVVKATGYQDLAFTLEVPKQSNHSSGSSGSSSSRTYSVTVEDSQNGTVTASPKRAEKGHTVSVTASANSGYAVSGVTVKTTGGDTVKVTDNGNGKYTFTMPAANVTVTAAFSKTQTTVSFADVSSDSYCADAVKWAVDNGVTNGTTATTFSPNAACTRGQIVTFLWRAAGSPAPKTTVNPFTDVAADAYYAKAVLWAVENGITNGTTATTFRPDAPCTRAQAVTFLFRGAIANGLEAVTLQDLLSGFSDAASLPGYAMPAMNWALANGIVQGNGGALMPNNTCTRGQIVTFLYRYMK